ncbi:hypothetical protein K466DRAFT_601064 [Polyporus arcularius HHB13444]|uniref:BTB domain-containing protein n=1 Tax=Polyporus arcularius HHB13444 TaxID=1314778 RepID=A0A5C3PBG5_9APHY|nr:hypothetical protein K466DRAFT_601064 [Polyporus arcularius HHB13444]
MDVASLLQINTAPPQLIPDQVPTPPPSISSSPTIAPRALESEEGVPCDVSLSISRTFHPKSKLLPPQPDTIFRSSDNVLFYVHRTVIREKSANDWNGRLPQLPASTHSIEDGGMGKVTSLPESAAALNIVFHAVYGYSCAHYSPTLDDIIAGVDAMAIYGVPPKDHILPCTPLYVLILNHAPLAPLPAYTLAAFHDIHSLAVPISTHLLSIPLGPGSLTDATLQRMGPIYLKRLLCLQLDRVDKLRGLLVSPPLPHPPTKTCHLAVERTRLTRAWTLAASRVAWDASADMSSSAIEAAFLPLAEQLTCPLCAESLATCVRRVVDGWSAVKRSIE